MTKQHWNTDDIEDQTGRVAIVTGANSGIGFETAKALAEKGAHVIVASRSEQRGQQAVANIAKAAPQADVDLMLLDLASLDSVKQFVTDFIGRFDRLDLLLNNAGVMMPKQREETEDGFELQFGTNHLGHFALTVQLLPLLVATESSRVVNVSSNAQDLGKLNLDDLQWTDRPFERIASYSASKIANMLFTLELQRRLEDAGVSTIAAACHPGYTKTNLQRNSWLLRWLNPIVCMEPWQGALPTLYAATSRDVEGGGYYGPNGFRHIRGYPAPDKPADVSIDADAAMRLWELSEKHTGLTAPSLGRAKPAELRLPSLERGRGADGQAVGAEAEMIEQLG